MALESYVDEKRRCVVVKIKGDFTVEGVVEMINRSVRDPGYQPGFGILSDHTEVGEPVTTPQARQIVKHFGSLPDIVAGTRWAAVTSRPASYGMLRMVSTLAEAVSMDVEVFRSLEEAEAWLLESNPQSVS